MCQAMLVVGYNDAKKVLKIMNSRWTHWREGGFSRYSYDLFKQVVVECRIAKDAKGDKEINTNVENKIYSENPIVNKVLSDLTITNVNYNSRNPDDPERVFLRF